MKKKKLDVLKSRDINPRVMDDADRVRLGKTLREFGDLGGVVLNIRSGQLVGGHQRVQDFRSDEQAEVVVERKLEKPDATGSVAFGYVVAHGTRYSYREVDWPAKKEAAANLAANRVHGEFDMPQVAEMLRGLGDGFDFELTGFDPGEVVDILGGDHPTSVDAEPKIDRAEELAKEWGVKPGQVWVLGAHRLMCGDSTKKDDVSKLMIGERADLCFTSPPYALGKSIALSGNKTASKKKNAYSSYVDDGKNWGSLMRDWFDTSLGHVSELWVINVQLLAGNKRDLIGFLSDNSDRLIDLAIWDKGHAPPSMAKGVMSSRFELLLMFGSVGASRSVPLSSWRGTVQNVYSGPPQRGNKFAESHAATMPIHLPLWVIGTLCDNSKTVYEPFCGTGTTLMACEQTARRCRAIEIDPGYVAVAIQRWADATGGQPKLA